ncbi:FUSC family protein [Bradyrhizobium sp. LA6.12]|uniref:ABC transporter permease subunit n=1 Tax=unclassified Bradyrhizobium TaxID=2631580 RepID=UPI003394A901
MTLSPSAAAIRAEMKGALARFAEAPLPDLPPPSPEEAKLGFFLPDAFTNPEHLHYAPKTTAAAMFCYITFTLLDWPGIHTALITCHIVSLGTTGETVEKLTLRILLSLSLYDSIWALIIFHTAFQTGFAMLFLRNVVAALPNELFEAARLEGAGELAIIWRIIGPAVPRIDRPSSRKMVDLSTI